MTIKGLLNCLVDGRGTDPPAQSNTSDADSSAVFGFSNVRSNMYVLPQTYFITLYKFLNSSDAQALGIVRRAFSAGNTTIFQQSFSGYTSTPGAFNGTLEYWDHPTPAGPDAWAVFEFTNASPKFWVLIQWSSTRTASSDANGCVQWAENVMQGLGATTGAKAVVASPFKNSTMINCSTLNNTAAGATAPELNLSGVGIQIAFNNDGTSPWLGTTVNSGSDTKGSASGVWSTSSVVFPRGNSLGGLNARSKYHMINLYAPFDIWHAVNAGGSNSWGSSQLGSLRYYGNNGTIPTDPYDTVFHIIIDENTLMILTDHHGIGNFSYFYFGKYDSFISSSNPKNVCLFSYPIASDQDDMFRQQQIYGSFNSSGLSVNNNFWNSTEPNESTVSNLVYCDGGVVDPSTGLAAGLSVDVHPAVNNFLNGFSNSIMSSTGSFNKKKFEIYKPILYLNEIGRRSMIGELSFFKVVNGGISSNATFFSRSLAVFGNTKLNSYKLVVPWNGRTPPGTAFNRSGTLW